MTKLEKKLSAGLGRFGLDVELPVIVAVSGGPDSVALLDALVRRRRRDRFPKEIIVAHLNHQLRGRESDEDEDFVRELSASLSLGCFVEQIDVAKLARDEKLNLEAAARRLRYEFLERAAVRHQSVTVFTGHTRDDQIETILMRLLRGSGPEGLRGIYDARPMGEKINLNRLNRLIRLIRPMLDVTRDEVLEHCSHYGIKYRTDRSNLSTDLSRNRIRQDLVPLLKSFNPRYGQALLRAAELLATDEEYLQQISAELLTTLQDGVELEIGPLEQTHPAIRRRVLRRWLREGGARRIDSTHLAAIENLISDSQSGRSLSLPGNLRLRREFNRIVLDRNIPRNSGGFGSVDLREDANQDFGAFKFALRRNVPRESARIAKIKECARYAAVLRECDELGGLRIRCRIKGDAYVPQGRHDKIKLKTLMIRHKIPASQRDAYPVIVTAEDQIVWSPGLPLASRFSVDEKEISNVALVIAERSDA